MEQSKQYNWIWAKRINDSWEEQAFAEDTARYVEDYTWPPRSYSCSFCGREFKSAQALGGHMNVHRRDRARLKQSPNSTTPTQYPPLPPPVFNNFLNPPLPSMATDHQEYYSPQKYSFISNQISSDSDQFTSPASDPNRVPINNTPFPSRILQETKKTRFSSTESLSDLVQENRYFCDRFKYGEKGHDQISHSKRPSSKEDQLIEKADLSVNFGLLFEYSINSEDMNPTCKKRRRMLDSELIFDHSKVVKLSLSPNCIDELDLELRLGDPPKLK